DRGAVYQLDEAFPQLRADVPFGGVFDGEWFGEPRRGQVFGERGQLGGQRLLGAPVLSGEELGELPFVRLGVAAEQQVPAVDGGQEVVRVSAYQGELDIEQRQ